MDPKQRLFELYKTRAFQFGTFKLASGKISPYYINSKKVLFNSEAVYCLGEVLYQMTHTLGAQGIGGLEVGAIPMSAAAVMAYHLHGQTIEGFFVRKAAKDHGSKGRIEGEIAPGQKVIVIDDVLTTGGSVVQAIKEVEALGATVARVICVVDRLQGAAQALAGYDYQPMFTIRDFGVEPLKD